MAVSVGQVEQLIEKIAPKAWAEDWDNPGRLVGSSTKRVNRILLTLDGTPEVVEEARERQAELIIAHHPLMFKPLKNLRDDQQMARVPLALVRHDIAYYAAHTNLDQSFLNSSMTYARLLQCEGSELLEVKASENLLKLVTFVPAEQVEEVRQALAAEGVGAGVTDGKNSDQYTDCFFQTAGEGMFRALAGAAPFIGQTGELTRVQETRLESILEERRLGRVLRALHRAHPYEEPAYDLIPLKNKGKARGYGLVGSLPQAQPLHQVWSHFLSRLRQETEQLCGRSGEDWSSLRLAGDEQQPIRKIAFANGSGSSFVQKALFKGADLLITGELDYHSLLDARQGGMAVLEMGHFLSEIPMMTSLSAYLKGDKEMKGVEILLSEKNRVLWK